MPLWQIEPATHPGDSRWQGRPIWRRVIVRAPSAAFARLYASRLDAPNTARRGPGNESAAAKSGFSDEKLYWVRRLDEPAAGVEATGPDGVVTAENGAA